MRFRELAAIAGDVVAAAQRRLPAAVRHAAREVPVCFETRPNAALRADGLEADLLGLFVGRAHNASLGEGGLPPQILLFLTNLWDYAEADRQAYEEEVRITYLHELGHYLGWDEADLADRGLE